MVVGKDQEKINNARILAEAAMMSDMLYRGDSIQDIARAMNMPIDEAREVRDVFLKRLERQTDEETLARILALSRPYREEAPAADTDQEDLWEDTEDDLEPKEKAVFVAPEDEPGYSVCKNCGQRAVKYCYDVRIKRLGEYDDNVDAVMCKNCGTVLSVFPKD